jgi:16S rRNA (cytidine1402-2'-O)-methyltransferase
VDICGILYLVATPIGNLSDMSQRAVDVLSQVDCIAAEDTRNTLRLLNHFKIKKTLISYHEHNKIMRGNQIIEDILNGKSYALVSDAGMPAISDPGEDLVRLCHENGIKINVIPGASAVVCAVAASGMSGGRFCFEGFLSTAKKRRTEHLKALKEESRTMIFYEAPHKLISTLNDFAAVFSKEREILIARELTKKYEEITRTTIEGAIGKYKDVKPLGEFVLVVAGKPAEKLKAEDNQEAAKEMIQQLKKEGMTNKEVLLKVCENLNLKRNQIYHLINK